MVQKTCEFAPGLNIPHGQKARNTDRRDHTALGGPVTAVNDLSIAMQRGGQGQICHGPHFDGAVVGRRAEDVGRGGGHAAVENGLLVAR